MARNDPFSNENLRLQAEPELTSAQTVATPEPETTPETPSSDDMQRMQQETTQTRPGSSVPRKVMDQVVSGMVQRTGFGQPGAVPQKQAMSKADDLIGQLEAHVKSSPDVAEDLAAITNAMRRHEATVRGVADDESREGMIHAIGKLAAGLVGLASLQDKDSLGINVGGLQFDKTDFKQKYDRLYQDYLTEIRNAESNMARKDKTFDRTQQGLGQLAGMAVSREEAEKERALKRELTYAQIRASAAKAGAKKVKSVDKVKLVDLNRETIDKLRATVTEKAFNDLSEESAWSVTEPLLQRLNVPAAKIQAFKNDVFGQLYDSDPDAIAPAAVDLGNQYVNKIKILGPEGEKLLIDVSEIDKAIQHGYQVIP